MECKKIITITTTKKNKNLVTQVINLIFKCLS